MKREEFKNKITKEFLACLEGEKLPWVKEWQTGRSSFQAYNYASGKRYKGSNRFWLEMVISAKGYQTNAFMTYKQVEAKGWSLKDAKGEGIPVSFWYPWNKKTKKNLTWEEYNQLLKSDKEEDKKTLANVIILEKIYYVFNARHIVVDEKTEKTLETRLLAEMPKHEHTQEDISAADAVLNEYCEAEGIDIIYGGDVACYSPVQDNIKLPERSAFSADTFYVSTKAHECAHSTGHQSRFDRKLAGAWERDSYAVEELRAEISAAFLCADFGLPQVGKVVENSKAYIQNWIEGLKDKPDTLLKALEEAEKISSYIKEKGGYAQLFEKEELKTAS